MDEFNNYLNRIKQKISSDVSEFGLKEKIKDVKFIALLVVVFLVLLFGFLNMNFFKVIGGLFMVAIFAFIVFYGNVS